jgi:hypothetical protein
MKRQIMSQLKEAAQPVQIMSQGEDMASATDYELMR